MVVECRTVCILIRQRILWCLIWVCTVCSKIVCISSMETWHMLLVQEKGLTFRGHLASPIQYGNMTHVTSAGERKCLLSADTWHHPFLSLSLCLSLSVCLSLSHYALSLHKNMFIYLFDILLVAKQKKSTMFENIWPKVMYTTFTGTDKVDPDLTPQSVLSGSALCATHSAALETLAGSKIQSLRGMVRTWIVLFLG